MVSSHKLSSLADHKEEILRFKKYRANAMNGESAVVLYCMQRIYRNRIAYKIQCNLINQSVSSQSIIFTRSRKYIVPIIMQTFSISEHSFLFGSQIEYLRTHKSLVHQYIAGEVAKAFFVRNINNYPDILKSNMSMLLYVQNKLYY